MTPVVDLRRPTRRVVALGRCLTSSELRALQPLLGDSFVVVDDEWLEGDDIVITPTMSEPVLGLLKSRHPGCLVLCVVRRAPPASAEGVTALDHGADGCV